MDALVILPLLAVPMLPMLALVGFIFWKVSSSGSELVAPADPRQPWRMYARVLRPDQQFSLRGQLGKEQYGTLTITATHLLWESEGGTRWAAAIPAITVTGLNGAMSVTAAPSVDVWIEGSGPWRLNVSDKPVNRIATNSAKTFREARAATQFAACLVLRGAQRTG